MTTESPENRTGWRAVPGCLWVFGAILVLISVLCAVQITKPDKATPVYPSQDAKRVCQEQFIPDRLKAPSTAKFSEVTVSSSGDVYTVTGKVDADNSFGARVRSGFTCIVRDTGKTWRLQSATVDS